MIEKRRRSSNLDEILAVPGIDMIQWGPADYAMSIGRPGGWYDDDVREVERDVLARCLAAGIPARAEITEPAEAAYYLDQGVRHFCIGTDINILLRLARKARGRRSWPRSSGADRADAPGAGRIRRPGPAATELIPAATDQTAQSPHPADVLDAVLLAPEDEEDRPVGLEDHLGEAELELGELLAGVGRRRSCPTPDRATARRSRG